MSNFNYCLLVNLDVLKYKFTQKRSYKREREDTYIITTIFYVVSYY